jgi:hypothetical protein
MARRPTLISKSNAPVRFTHSTIHTFKWECKHNNYEQPFPYGRGPAGNAARGAGLESIFLTPFF